MNLEDPTVKKIRLLTWEAQNVDKTLWCSELTPMGEFRVQCNGVTKWSASRRNSPVEIGEFSGSKEAKKACQEEYQRLVKSCFE